MARYLQSLDRRLIGKPRLLPALRKDGTEEKFIVVLGEYLDGGGNRKFIAQFHHKDEKELKNAGVIITSSQAKRGQKSKERKPRTISLQNKLSNLMPDNTAGGNLIDWSDDETDLETNQSQLKEEDENTDSYLTNSGTGPRSVSIRGSFSEELLVDNNLVAEPNETSDFGSGTTSPQEVVSGKPIQSKVPINGDDTETNRDQATNRVAINKNQVRNGPLNTTAINRNQAANKKTENGQDVKFSGSLPNIIPDRVKNKGRSQSTSSMGSSRMVSQNSEMNRKFMVPKHLKLVHSSSLSHLPKRRVIEARTPKYSPDKNSEVDGLSEAKTAIMEHLSNQLDSFHQKMQLEIQTLRKALGSERKKTDTLRKRLEVASKASVSTPTYRRSLLVKSRGKGKAEDDAVQIRKKISRGGSGANIYECVVNGWVCCMKELLLEDVGNTKLAVNALRTEIRVLEALPSHPNIVQFLFHTIAIKYIRIFTTLYSQTLRNLILQKESKGHQFAPVQVCQFLYDILNGMAFLHSHGIFHRDLKSDNIFVSSDISGDNILVIGDFDQAHHFYLSMTKEVVGTPGYISPEVLKGDTSYDYPADVWSFGMIVYELLRLHRPYFELAPINISTAVLNGSTPRIPDHSSENPGYIPLWSMHKACLFFDPQQRFTVEALREDLVKIYKSLSQV